MPTRPDPLLTTTCAVLRADPKDPNRLDGSDQDGLACESNPAPKDLVPVPKM